MGNNACMKLLVVDDHAILREGLAALLQQFEHGADVLQASDAAEGLRLAEANPDLDVIFLDLNMPEHSGRDAIPLFAKRCPQLPLIVLSSSEDPNDVRSRLEGVGRLRLRAEVSQPAKYPFRATSGAGGRNLRTATDVGH